MKKLLVATAVALAVGNASADTLFSNFPDTGYGANSLGSGGGGSQEFTLAATSTLTSVAISEWVFGGNPSASAISWNISSGAKGAGSIAAGVSSATGVQSALSYIYTTSFALPNITLAAGNYFVTLSSNTSGYYDGWGVTTNPPFLQSYTSSDMNTWYDTSTSYQNILSVQGTSAPVPEPEMYSILLLGLGLMAGMVRRNRA